MYPNIVAECARIGWNRAQLAKYLDASYGSVGNWIRGTTDLPASKLIKMAQLFCCSTDYLLGIRENRTNM